MDIQRRIIIAKQAAGLASVFAPTPLQRVLSVLSGKPLPPYSPPVWKGVRVHRIADEAEREPATALYFHNLAHIIHEPVHDYISIANTRCRYGWIFGIEKEHQGD